MSNATTTPVRRYSVVRTGKGFDIHGHGCHHAAKAGFNLFDNFTARQPEHIQTGMARDYAEQGVTAEGIRIMSCCGRAPIAR